MANQNDKIDWVHMFPTFKQRELKNPGKKNSYEFKSDIFAYLLK